MTWLEIVKKDMINKNVESMILDRIEWWKKDIYDQPQLVWESIQLEKVLMELTQ